MTIYALFFAQVAIAIWFRAFARRRLAARWDEIVGIGVPTVILGAFILFVSEPAPWFGDFTRGYYWGAARALETPMALYGRGSKFTNIPIVALAFAPFVRLDPRMAAEIFTAIGVSAVVAFAWLAERWTAFGSSEPLPLFALVAVNGPLYYSLLEGNTTHFILLGLLFVVYCRATARDYAAGAILAVCAILKPFLALLGAYYVVRGRWKVVAGIGVCGVLIVTASILVFGLDLHLAFFGARVAPHAEGAVASFNNQSVNGLFARMLARGNLMNYWHPLELGGAFAVLRLATLVGLFATAAWACGTRAGGVSLATERVELSIVLCLALLASPVSWTHYYLLLLLPVALAGEGWLGFAAVARHRTAIFAAVVLLMPPVVFVEAHTFVGRLLLSHYVFGATVLFATLLAIRREADARA